MHEFGLAESALRAALDEARKAGAVQVLRVVVRVGEWSGVDPEAFRFAFEAIRSGTPADHATLEIDPVPAVVHCCVCASDFAASDGLPGECPECGAAQTTLIQGRELDLVRLELC